MTLDEATKKLVEAVEAIEEGGWKVVDFQFTVDHEVKQAAAIVGLGSTLYIIDKDTD